MEGKHRIPRCMDKKMSDPEFEGLLRIDPDRLSRNLSPFFIRPAYDHTKAPVGGIHHELSDV